MQSLNPMHPEGVRVLEYIRHICIQSCRVSEVFGPAGEVAQGQAPSKRRNKTCKHKPLKLASLLHGSCSGSRGQDVGCRV